METRGKLETKINLYLSIDYRAKFESMINEDLVRELSALSEEMRKHKEG